ncbi:unnamed protein product [Rotaria sp. Silwood1]|nr:unnamed protein product [Rotaria sp. Silwood1]
MSHDHHHQQHQQEYENIDAQTRVSYERFLEFERLMKMYPPSSSQNFNSTKCNKFQLGHLNLQRAADAFGIITASIAWYAAFASLLKRGVNSYFSLPVYNLAPDSPLIIIDESSTNIRTQKI